MIYPKSIDNAMVQVYWMPSLSKNCSDRNLIMSFLQVDVKIFMYTRNKHDRVKNKATHTCSIIVALFP